MIPVTILTGFLGSGKTTILAHLMRDPALADTAVIINEFGDIGLDHDLIETSDETIVSLQTGCLCCKIQDDLTATLHNLLARRDQGTVSLFERVVIETSGLADPVPILQSLMIDDVITGHMKLARVVTVIDAVNGVATLQRQPEARRQLAVGDHLIVSKSDLVVSRSHELDVILSDINRSAPIDCVSNGRVDPAVLFPTRSSASNAAAIASSLSTNDRPSHRHSEITTFAIVRERPIAAVALSLFLEALADHCGADLLRMKGIVDVVESPGQPAVIHGVQHIFQSIDWLHVWPGDDRRTRIVFIGRDIHQTWINALLHAIETEVDEQAASRPI
jgi:G3E family GTPase